MTAPGATCDILVRASGVRIVVIVPHWGAIAPLAATLEALRGMSEAPDQVIVVCNDASMCACVDAVAQRCENRGPAIVVLHARANVGYAGAANAAMRWLWSTGRGFDLYWILNNDATPSRECLAQLRALAAAQCREAVGVVSCCIMTPDGAPADSGQYQPWLGRFSPPRADGSQGLDGVSGASFLVTHAFACRTSGLPEHLFMYFEESWIACAARALRFQVVACPDALVRHRANTSLASLPGSRGREVREYLDARARMILAIEWHPWCLVTLLPIMVARALMAAASGDAGACIAVVTAVADGVCLRLREVPELRNRPLTTRDSWRALRAGPSRWRRRGLASQGGRT